VRLTANQGNAQDYGSKTIFDDMDGAAADLLGEKIPVAQGATYLGGMFRGCQDRFFIKVTGQEDTPEIKTFFLAIARHPSEQIKTQGTLPGLVSCCPRRFARTGFVIFIPMKI